MLKQSKQSQSVYSFLSHKKRKGKPFTINSTFPYSKPFVVSPVSKNPCSCFIFSYKPRQAFEPGGLLAGLKLLTQDRHYQTARAKALFEIIRVNPKDPEYCLGELLNGRWALFGLVEEGHRFALETA